LPGSQPIAYARGMTPAQVFDLANLLPLPIWAVWIVAPRSQAARLLAGALWPWAVLGALYVAVLAIGMAEQGGFDPHAFGSLDGVMRLFQSPWIAVAGWVHYLCFDLFVARWIVNDAPDAGYRRAPVLLLTFLFGPLGLVTYLLARPALRRPREA